VLIAATLPPPVRARMASAGFTPRHETVRVPLTWAPVTGPQTSNKNLSPEAGPTQRCAESLRCLRRVKPSSPAPRLRTGRRLARTDEFPPAEESLLP
jgi:hypothetical protein